MYWNREKSKHDQGQRYQKCRVGLRSSVKSEALLGAELSIDGRRGLREAVALQFAQEISCQAVLLEYCLVDLARSPSFERPGDCRCLVGSYVRSIKNLGSHGAEYGVVVRGLRSTFTRYMYLKGTK